MQSAAAFSYRLSLRGLCLSRARRPNSIRLQHALTLALLAQLSEAAACPSQMPRQDPRQDVAAAGQLQALQRASASSAALAFDVEVQHAAAEYRIDPRLLHAIAHVESRHRSKALSPAGALGLMQVMPATATRFGLTQPERQLLDPAVSLRVSAAYLKRLQARFGNVLPLVLAAYNAGEAAVERHGRQIPPYAETRSYVRQVMSCYALLRAKLRVPAE